MSPAALAIDRPRQMSYGTADPARCGVVVSMEMEVIRSSDLARRAALRLALAVLALAAVLLMGGRAPAGATPGEHQGVRFSVRCEQTGQTDRNQLGSITCALIVSGLPAPLNYRVAVTLLTEPAPHQGPTGSAHSDTLTASDLPAFTPDAPSLVSREVSSTPLQPQAAPLHILPPPPKSL